MKFKKLFFTALTLFAVVHVQFGECQKCKELEEKQKLEELEEHIEQEHNILDPLFIWDPDDGRD